MINASARRSGSVMVRARPSARSCSPAAAAAWASALSVRACRSGSVMVRARPSASESSRPARSCSPAAAAA